MDKFCLGAAIVFAVIAVVFFGMHVMDVQAGLTCDRFGQVQLNSHIYLCTRKEGR